MMMDIPFPSTFWLPELEMGEPNDIVNPNQQTCTYYSDSVNSFSLESFNDYTNAVNQSVQATTINGDPRKKKDSKAIKISTFAPNDGYLSNTRTISFGNPTLLPPLANPISFGGSKLKYAHEAKLNQDMSFNVYHGSMQVPKRVPYTRRNHRQAQEHLFAERKRREKLAQRFNSLYALLPQINKMDKATVLEDASNYIKQLEKRVKELEEGQVKGKHIIQKSTISIWRSNLCGGLYAGKDDTSSCKKAKTLLSNISYDPEIVVTSSGNSILVRIYCQRNPSVVLTTLTEMERLHLAIISSSVLPFSNTAHLITVNAQMSEELRMTAIELVKCLQSALSNIQ